MKRYISEYSSYVLLAIICFLLYKGFHFVGILLCICWYLLFGLVGLAFMYTSKGNYNASNFLLKITIPITLLPFRKAFYYWAKAINTAVPDPSQIPKAFELTKKVNPEHLYTNNNKSIYYSFLASIHSDIGDKQMAMRYLKMSEQLPHHKMLDETLENIRASLAE